MAYYDSKEIPYLCTSEERIWARDIVSGAEDPPIQDSNTRGYISGSDRRVGSSCWNWKQKIARGENATTYFEGREQRLKNVQDADWEAYRWQWTNWGYMHKFRAHLLGWHRYGGSWPGHLFSSSEIDAIGSRALSKMLKRYQSRVKSFEGLVFAGELRETLRMLRSPLRGVLNLLDAYFTDVYSKNKRYKKRDRLRRSGELWLEYSFGLSPLLSDLEDGLKAYSELGHRDEREFVSAYIEDRKSEDSGWSISSAQAGINAQTRIITDSVCRVSYKACVAIQPYKPPGSDFATRFGFTAQDIGSALWELTPWSWLIDRFSNIGDVIEAGFMNLSAFKWGVVTRRTYTTRTYIMRPEESGWLASNPPGSWVKGTPGIMVYTNKLVQRSPVVNWLPDVTWEIPGLNRTWIHLSALTASRVKALRSF